MCGIKVLGQLPLGRLSRLNLCPLCLALQFNFRALALEVFNSYGQGGLLFYKAPDLSRRCGMLRSIGLFALGKRQSHDQFFLPSLASFHLGGRRLESASSFARSPSKYNWAL